MELNNYKDKFKIEANKKIEWMLSEFDKIRSGRANIGVLNGIKVNSYGNFVPLNQVANMQIVDARQIIIKPYDRSQISEIAGAVSKSNLNLNPQINPDNIRLIFPMQTEENRKISVKKAKQVLEDAKILIRNVRRDVNDLIKREADISEDLIKHYQNELDKVTKEYVLKLEDIFSKKEKDLMSL